MQSFVNSFELRVDCLGNSSIFIAGDIEVHEKIRKLLAGIPTLHIFSAPGKLERTRHRVVPEHCDIATGRAAGAPANEILTGS